MGQATRQGRSAGWSMVLIGAVAATLLLITPGWAAAHSALSGSDPAEGSTVTAIPATVSLTFNDGVLDVEPVLLLLGPDQAEYQTGSPVTDGRTLSTAVDTTGPAGAYTVVYRVVSADGHPVQGTLAFTYAPPPGNTPVAPTTAPAPPTDLSTAGTVGAAAGSPPTGTAEAETVTTPEATSVVVSSSVSTAYGATTGSATGTLSAMGATAGEDSGGGLSGWVWAAIVATVVFIAAAVLLFTRSRRNPT